MTVMELLTVKEKKSREPRPTNIISGLFFQIELWHPVCDVLNAVIKRRVQLGHPCISVSWTYTGHFHLYTGFVHIRWSLRCMLQPGNFSCITSASSQLFGVTVELYKLIELGRKEDGSAVYELPCETLWGKDKLVTRKSQSHEKISQRAPLLQPRQSLYSCHNSDKSFNNNLDFVLNFKI